MHDVLLFLSAAAVSLILVEYMVKGCVITLKQSFFQGWICYVAVYAAAYLICGNVRIGVCLGMAISMIHGMIDHYVMLFRGTPVMLSDIAAIGTAANVSKGYSAPMELSVLRAAAGGCAVLRERVPDAAQLQGAQALVLPQTVFAAVRARAGVHRLHRHPDGRHRTGFLAVQPPVQRDFLLPALRDQLVCQAAGGLQRGRAFCRTERIYRQTGHENAQSDRDHERILLGSRLGRYA